jgi:hypothetical protein
LRSYRNSQIEAVTIAVVLALTRGDRIEARSRGRAQSSGLSLPTSGPVMSGQNCTKVLVNVNPRAEAAPNVRPSSGSRNRLLKRKRNIGPASISTCATIGTTTPASRKPPFRSPVMFKCDTAPPVHTEKRYPRTAPATIVAPTTSHGSSSYTSTS